MWRRFMFALVLALSAHVCAHASTVDLRAQPRMGDPNAMYLIKDRATNNVHLITSGVPVEGASEYSFLFWCAIETRPSSVFPYMVPYSFISVDPGLATSEGGDMVEEFTDYGYPHEVLPLSSSGTWSDNCLPPASDYWLPPALEDTDWQYGCYTVNIITDTALTLTVGGDERQVPASPNNQVLTFKPGTADRSVAIAAESPDAQVSLAIADCPLRQFFSEYICQYIVGMSADDVERAISNRWVMICLQAKIEDNGSKLITSQKALDLDGYSPKDENCHTNTIAQPRADGCFAKNARIEYLLFAPGGVILPDGEYYDGGRYMRRSTWGAKFYPTWLSDEMLYHIRDTDAATIIRRGLGPFVDFSTPGGE